VIGKIKVTWTTLNFASPVKLKEILSLATV